MQLKFTSGWGTHLFSQIDLYNIDLIRNGYNGILGIDLFVLCRPVLVLWAKNWKILDCPVAEKVDFRQKCLKSYTLIIYPFLGPPYKKDSASREINKGSPGLLRAGAFFLWGEDEGAGLINLQEKWFMGTLEPSSAERTQALCRGAKDNKRQWAWAHWIDVQNTLN